MENSANTTTTNKWINVPIIVDEICPHQGIDNRIPVDYYGAQQPAGLRYAIEGESQECGLRRVPGWSFKELQRCRIKCISPNHEAIGFGLTILDQCDEAQRILYA